MIFASSIKAGKKACNVAEDVTKKSNAHDLCGSSKYHLNVGLGGNISVANGCERCQSKVKRFDVLGSGIGIRPRCSATKCNPDTRDTVNNDGNHHAYGDESIENWVEIFEFI